MMLNASKSRLLKWAGLAACSLFAACSAETNVSANNLAQVQVNQARLAELSELFKIEPKAMLCSAKSAAIRKLAVAAPQPRPQTRNASKASQLAGRSEIMDHSHVPVAVPEGVAVPRLSITITPDVMSGYNLSIKTQNYVFMPPPFKGQTMETLMEPVIDPELGFVQGHAHLYINSEKIQRIYGNNVHLPKSLFKNGMNQLNVTINNHAHMFWAVGEKEIISSVFINTNMLQLVMYQFDSFPVETRE